MKELTLLHYVSALHADDSSDEPEFNIVKLNTISGRGSNPEPSVYFLALFGYCSLLNLSARNVLTN